MRVLVTGGRGMLGKSVLKVLRAKGHTLFVADLPETDIVERESILGCAVRCQPHAVIHCAAFTDVEKAEKESEKAFLINAGGAENVAYAAEKVGAKLVYISTDYVFSGKGNEPWKTEDALSPLNEYGKSKAAGEKRAREISSQCFIVRTAWLFGDGKNFVRSMLAAGKEKKVVEVVDDQVGSPTFTDDLSGFLSELITTEKYGIYHATNEGFCSWAEFAEEIFRAAEKYDGAYAKTVVKKIASGEYLSRVERPKNGRLDKSSLKKAGFSPLPFYQDALKRYLEREWVRSRS